LLSQNEQVGVKCMVQRRSTMVIDHQAARLKIFSGESEKLDALADDLGGKA
jgi:hypothetical protein